MREASKRAMGELLRGCKPGEHTLVAAATDSSALGVLDAVREAGLEAHFAIVGQDCIPEVMEEMRRGTSLANVRGEPRRNPMKKFPNWRVMLTAFVLTGGVVAACVESDALRSWVARANARSTPASLTFDSYFECRAASTGAGGG